MVLFLQKDYAGAKKLLDEADAIQPNQGNSVTLRNQIFKQYYEAAYTAYQHADYPTALGQLDGADGTGTNAQNQSDAYNLRGLILSKQQKYESAETMFHKAVQTDPGLWAAKFNYAEVPFNYRNFTVARARFEELFSQTDPVKQPVEAELTQFKVFLTLLLEGKEDAARTFMQHFNFSGATPARYFCQSALNFYAGDVEKAQGWIDSARKEYPARKSSSFLEAFYRVGWLTDPNAVAPGVPPTAVAAASPSVAPAASSPAPALAAVTPPGQSAAKPSPAASPAVASSSPSAMPAFRAAVTPPPLVLATPVAASPSPSATVMAKASPTAVPATPTPALAKASPTAAPASPAPGADGKSLGNADPVGDCPGGRQSLAHARAVANRASGVGQSIGQHCPVSIGHGHGRSQGFADGCACDARACGGQGVRDGHALVARSCGGSGFRHGGPVHARACGPSDVAEGRAHRHRAGRHHAAACAFGVIVPGRPVARGQ